MHILVNRLSELKTFGNSWWIMRPSVGWLNIPLKTFRIPSGFVDSLVSKETHDTRDQILHFFFRKKYDSFLCAVIFFRSIRLSRVPLGAPDIGKSMKSYKQSRSPYLIKKIYFQFETLLCNPLNFLICQWQFAIPSSTLTIFASQWKPQSCWYDFNRSLNSPNYG